LGIKARPEIDDATGGEADDNLDLLAFIEACIALVLSISSSRRFWMQSW
jgi:hypothetical protein